MMSNKCWRFFSALLVVCAVSFPQSANAQTNATQDQCHILPVPSVVFDVFSIRPSKPDAIGSTMNWGGGGFHAENVTLELMLWSFYKKTPNMIVGLPKWSGSMHWDIQAKVSDPDPDLLKKLSREQLGATQRRLLCDVFKLKTHTTMSERSVYDLIVAPGGLKMKQNEADKKDPDPAKKLGGWGAGNGQMDGTGIAVSQIIDFLEGEVERSVRDKTGLTALYDVKLRWAPESDGSTQNGDSTGPSLFTALQEQLGLKLQATKGPAETMVIDHIEMPEMN